MIGIRIFKGLGQMLQGAAQAAAYAPQMGAPQMRKKTPAGAPCTPCAANAMVQQAKARAQAIKKMRGGG